MDRYRYRGVDAGGVESQGTLEARSLADAARQLRDGGVYPLAVERAEPESPPEPLGEMDAFTYFNRSLAELCRVGVPLTEGVREVSLALRRGKFRDSIEEVEKALGEGKSLADAVGEIPRGFPAYYRAMIRAGISSGNLPRVLHSVARTHEGLRRAQRAVVSALAYPAVSFILGSTLVAIFILFFLPRIREFYRFHDLAPSTAVSLLFRAVDSPGVLAALILSLILVAAAAVVWVRRTPSGESFLRRLPGVGTVLQSLATARFLGALAVLLKAGARQEEALEVAAGASGSRILAGDARTLYTRAAEGEKLGEIIREARGLSPGVGAYLGLAEEGGNLAEAAGEVCELEMERASAGSDVLFVYLFTGAMLLLGVTLGAVIVTLASGYFDVLHQVPR